MARYFSDSGSDETRRDDDALSYYEKQAERGENAARLLVLLWIFNSGAIAGYVLRGLVG